MTPTQKRANIVRQIDKRIRDAIDTLREEIQLDYACFNAYELPVDEIRAYLVGIILRCKEAQHLCKELESL